MSLATIRNWISDKTGYAYTGDRLPRKVTQDNETITLDVPGYRQVEDFTCGFTAGLMIVHTFDKSYSADAFYDLVGSDPEWGVSTSKLVKALKRAGVGTEERERLTFAGVKRAIKSGYPLIASVQRPRDKKAGDDQEHWIVIYGYGPGRVYVANTGFPYLGNSKKWDWTKFQEYFTGTALICWGLE